MVDAVNRLIGNILAGPGALFLPDVGSLRTERQPARRISKRRILPPCRSVAFSSQPQGVSLVDEIAAAAGVDGEKAAEIYRTWLGRVRREERLEIEGVGTLVQKSFRLDPAFDRRINPAGREPVTVRSGRRFDFVLWLGVAAILFAVGFGGYWWWSDRTSDGQSDGMPSAVRTVSEANADRMDADPASEPTVGGSAGEAADREHAASAAESAVAGETGVRAGSATVPAGGEPLSDAAAERSEAELPGRSTAGGRDGSVSDAARVSGDGVLPLVSGRRYVVLGVFSTAENAARAVGDAAAKEPALRCTIYRFGAKYMVSPFESDDAETCTQFIRAHAQTAPGMWTYTAR